MGVVKKWLRDWMTRLMPKQKSSGDGAVQMGHVGGNVTINQITHRNVVRQASSVLGRQSGCEPLPMTEKQKEVLMLMKPLPDPVRITVLDFMRREFGTAMVKELQPRDLYRVRMYVLKVRQSARI